MGGGAGREALQGGDTCLPVTDSRCTAETNTTVKSSYTQIKQFFFLREEPILSTVSRLGENTVCGGCLPELLIWLSH